jgi:adiponectin receptor
LDFAGIAVTMGGSVTPFMYYGFMCEEMSWWRNFYLAELWSMSMLAMVVTLMPACKENNGIKAAVFLSAGWSCSPSLIHLTYFADPRYTPPFDPTPFLIAALIYTFGGIIYATRFPEKYFPRTFDIWGHSHQLFHCCVLVGALINIWFSVRCMHER